jgi:NADH-quinone oxidoreductase subunit E
MGFSALALVFKWDSHGLCAIYIQEVAALRVSSFGRSLGKIGHGGARFPVLAHRALDASRIPGCDDHSCEDSPMVDFEPTKLAKALAQSQGGDSLMAVLEEIQRQYRYLPQDEMILVSERLGLPLSQVYSVATFYHAFSLVPRGRHEICVCVGTACHVRGAHRVLARLEERLGIQPGETTPNWDYSLDTVHCLGACALGPIVIVDGEYSGQMGIRKVDELLARIEQADRTEA